MDVERVEGEIVDDLDEQVEITEYGVKRMTVAHPFEDGKTAFYYPERDEYRSDGSDGRQPGQFLKTPMHPEFERNIIRTSEDAQAALQKNRDKKRHAMELGVRQAIAQDAGKAIDEIKDTDAIAYATSILTTEIVLNPRAPARERWQFWTKMLEMSGIIDPNDVQGNKIAIQVNIDPAIGRTFR